MFSPFPFRKRSNRRLISEGESEEDIKDPLLKQGMENVELVFDPTVTSSRRAATIMQNVQKGTSPLFVLHDSVKFSSG